MKANLLVAKSIARERKRAKLSLSALADKAGLAKSTLSQLEAGQGNPNLETLWAIATALDVPFNFLFEVPEPQTSLIRAADGCEITSKSASYSATLLSDCPPNCRRVLYRFNLQPNTARSAEAHHDGTIEHAFVCSGEAFIGPDDNLEKMSPGDYYRYPADRPHTYKSMDEEVVLMVIIETSF
ncbi:helix-turn-helix domain-containing protein [Sneathiella sp. P13V-1]|uniref:helix-turn-helix domain-containing protein n=1 Tax=Sneathiella sp. P13V-1 TaxID=2697366 RepID=UPI00187B4369|nr:XRE family transcriptional regulator [Sneathiella sp. P13V-1]MBE7638225.1 helix-turn-helix domain-containing protein [Sneathiella sp. P13V-1]